MQPTLAELRAFELFADLPEGELEQALEAFHLVVVAEDEVLMGQDQAATWMGLVLEGELRVTRGHAGSGRLDEEEVYVATIAAGQVVGEMGLLGGMSRRQATIRTCRPTRLLVLDSWGLARLRVGCPVLLDRLECGVAEILVERLRDTTDAIAAMSVGQLLHRPQWRAAAPLRWWDGARLRLQARVPKVAEVVEQAPVFVALSPRQRQQLVRTAVLEPVPRGTVLLAEGEAAECGFLLVAGRVEVTCHASTGRDSAVASLSAGTAFGFASLIDGGRCSATCTTIAPSWVLRLRARTFRDAGIETVLRKVAIGSVTRRLGVADRALGRLVRQRRADAGPC